MSHSFGSISRGDRCSSYGRQTPKNAPPPGGGGCQHARPPPRPLRPGPGPQRPQRPRGGAGANNTITVNVAIAVRLDPSRWSLAEQSTEELLTVKIMAEKGIDRDAAQKLAVLMIENGLAGLVAKPTAGGVPTMSGAKSGNTCSRRARRLRRSPTRARPSSSTRRVARITPSSSTPLTARGAPGHWPGAPCPPPWHSSWCSVATGPRQLSWCSVPSRGRLPGPRAGVAHPVRLGRALSTAPGGGGGGGPPPQQTSPPRSPKGPAGYAAFLPLRAAASGNAGSTVSFLMLLPLTGAATFARHLTSSARASCW